MTAKTLQFKHDVPGQTLRDPESNVLCLRGKWGVGKTYLWDAEVRRAQEEGKLARHGYSKVSLFGVSTLEALKYAVFENSQWTINGIRPPSVETLEDFLNVRKPAGHKVGKLPRLKQIFSSASKLPFLEKYLGGAGAARTCTDVSLATRSSASTISSAGATD